MICMKLLRHELLAAVTGENELRPRAGHQQILLLRHHQHHKPAASLAVHDEDPPSLPTTHRLVTASSVNNVTRHAGGRHADNDDDDDDQDGFSPRQPGRVAGWAVNFDKLLQDPVGLAVFTGFLKKEFSEENVIFWTACEQYRKISDDQHRKAQAQEIYGRHLSSKASDPVNVDSAAKLYTEKFLDSPTAIMFDVAQHQIFQLMRQDSYSRFLKSDMYKGYLVKEIEGQPLIDPATGNPESNGAGTGKGDKKKGKGKENEEKRRRSILPWRQNKKSSMKSTSDPELKKMGKRTKDDKAKEKETNNNSNNNNNNNNNNSNNVSGDDSHLKVIISDSHLSNPGTASASASTTVVGQGKKGAGPGIDLSTMRKEVFHTKDKEVRDTPESQFKFCRIMLPDGSTTVVCAKPGQSCRVVLSKLCEKRSIALASVDVFLHGSSKPLDLEEDISVLGSKEIIIEKRVLFRLDMPNVKSIGVKAKPNRSVSEVFRPILQKYGFTLESIAVYVTGSQDPVNLDESVSCLDKQRVTIINTTDAAESLDPGLLPLSARQSTTSKTAATAAATGKNKNNNGGSSRGGVAGGGSLEEITNQIFDDLMRGKSQLAHGFDELGVVELDKAKVSKNDEGRSLGLFGLLRKESWGAKDRRPKGKGKVTFTLPGNDGKKKKEKDGEKLIRLLSGAQELRMEDQRGVEISTGEMPSFLHQDGTDNGQQHHTYNHQHHQHRPHHQHPHHLHNQQQQLQHPGVLEVHMEEEESASGDPTMTTAAATATGLERLRGGEIVADSRLTKSPRKDRRLVQQQQHQNTTTTPRSARTSSSPRTVAVPNNTTTPRVRDNDAALSSSASKGTSTINSASKGVSTMSSASKGTSTMNNPDKWNAHNKSFGPDSVIPSPTTAALYFQMSPEIVEMQKRLGNNHSPLSHNNNNNNNNINNSNNNNDHSRNSPNHSPHHLNHSHSPKTIPSYPIANNFTMTNSNTTSSFKPPHHDSIQSVHSSFYAPTKAPVASPEKFSPNLFLHNHSNYNNNNKNNNPASPIMLLPSKVSPTSPSSNSSSSSSSSIKRRPSSNQHQQHQPHHPQPQQPQNIARMSDGMLLHKLQKARQSSVSPRNGVNPMSSSQQFYDDYRNRSPAADLAQRALLSPRFDNNNEENNSDMTHSQRALLSPRVDHSYPNPNVLNQYNANVQHFHDYYYNRRSTPSPVRSRNSSPYKLSPSGDSNTVEPRPISSPIGPQLSSHWHNSNNYLLNTGQLNKPYHSPMGKQGNFQTDYLQEAGETVTFV